VHVLTFNAFFSGKPYTADNLGIAQLIEDAVAAHDYEVHVAFYFEAVYFRNGGDDIRQAAEFNYFSFYVTESSAYL
jgi:hypothetical protein